jgi:hypothetical protein
MDMKANLQLTRKAKHEFCKIQRAASVMNTSMETIARSIDDRGVFENEHYSVVLMVKSDNTGTK